jgi:methylmalonyl-CoA/ethylmalonyl-CoA epimerase
MRIKRIDHVAICVADVDQAKGAWERVFGLRGATREVVASQKTDALLLPVGDGDAAIELIAPKGNEGLDKFLAKRGPGLHHIAIEVEGIEDTLALLKTLGVRLIDETPRTGARGHKVAFIHPSVTGGVLIELVEPV